MLLFVADTVIAKSLPRLSAQQDKRVPFFALAGWFAKVSSQVPFWCITNILCFQLIEEGFLELSGLRVAPVRARLASAVL
jgi:hypothetical protein